MRSLSAWKMPILGTLVAIAITTTMDATGLTMFSALPLAPLLFLFWYLERFSRQDVGWVLGRRRDYGLALLHPLVVLVAVTLIVLVVGVVDISETNWVGLVGLVLNATFAVLLWRRLKVRAPA